MELVLNLDDRPCRARADACQIEQVILNLVVNARDSTPPGGRIIVSTHSEPRPFSELAALVEPPPASAHGPFVSLAVTDTGSGIAHHVLPHIFEPFFTTKGFGKGTGLGLSIVHGIVHRHGGAIGITSEPGKGAAFSIHLRACAPERDNPPQESARPQA
jgi:two-component system, cell cycle sensor histidine kinase and response regulator CckA